MVKMNSKIHGEFILFPCSLDLSILRAKQQNPPSYQAVSALSEKCKWLVMETIVAPDAYLLCIGKIRCMFLHNLS